MKLKKLLAPIMAAVMVVTSLNTGFSNKEVYADGFVDLSQNQIVSEMGAGWNLGNQLEASNNGIPSETAWNNPIITSDLIKQVKDSGFSSIRVPISYLNYIKKNTDGSYTIDENWLKRIKEVVDMCMDNDLYTIINMHGDGYNSVNGGWLLCNASDEEQVEIKKKYEAAWKIISTYFGDYDEHLIFESMNEEFDGQYTYYSSGPNSKYYDNINAYNQIFVDTVRKTSTNNSKRWLLIPGWNTEIDYTAGYSGFKIPTDNYLSSDITSGQKRIMVSVHYYSPWEFAGEGTKTQWGDNAVDSSKTASWGDKTYMKNQFKKLYDNFVVNGYPVVIGEYGATNANANDELNQACRIDFYNTLCTYAKQYGLVPVTWDNGGYGTSGGDQFALFNRNLKTVVQQDIINGIMSVYNPDKVVNDSGSGEETYYMAQLIDNGWNGNWGSPVAQTKITDNGDFTLSYTLSQNFNNQGAMYINTTIPVSINCEFEVEVIELNGNPLNFGDTKILDTENDGQWQFLFMNHWANPSFNGLGDYLNGAKAGDVLTITINVKKLFEVVKDVKVTIINAGEIALDSNDHPITLKDYTVYDTNDNDYIDVDDVLRTAHDEAGFSDGYATVNGQWGKAVSKLWGVENGGSYGYAINDEFADSLDDKVNNGDYICAYVFKDTESYTDTYTYFDKTELNLKYYNPTANLKLNKFFFNYESSKTESAPVTVANITTLEDSSIKGTIDNEGNVSITLKPGNTYTVVARNDESNYIPAFCKVTVEVAPIVISVDAKDPTCTEPGNSAYWYYEYNGVTYYYSDEALETPIAIDSWIVPELGHDWDDGVVTKEPTTTEKGIKTYTCKRCGETMTEEIDKLKDDGNDKDDDVTVDGPKSGTKIADKKYIYKVTKTGSTDGKIVGEVQVTGLKKKSLTTIKIAAKVTLGGVTYKVTSVGSKAFKGNKKIKKAYIGKNVKTIGAKAFFGAKKLKRVVINSKKLKKIGKKAFYRKGGKKLTFKVPKSKKKAYKKLLKKAKTNKFVLK